MSELEKVTVEKMDYMEMWVRKGNKLVDIVHDQTFINYLEKEDGLIEKRNQQLRQEKSNEKTTLR